MHNNWKSCQMPFTIGATKLMDKNNKFDPSIYLLPLILFQGRGALEPWSERQGTPWAGQVASLSQGNK